MIDRTIFEEALCSMKAQKDDEILEWRERMVLMDTDENGCFMVAEEATGPVANPKLGERAESYSSKGGPVKMHGHPRGTNLYKSTDDKGTLSALVEGFNGADYPSDVDDFAKRK